MPGSNLNRIYTTIEALLVIHNILLGRNDDPTEIEGYNGEEDLGLFGLARAGIDNDAVHRAQNIDRMVDADLYRTGLHRRKLLLELHEIENNYM